MGGCLICTTEGEEPNCERQNTLSVNPPLAAVKKLPNINTSDGLPPCVTAGESRQRVRVFSATYYPLPQLPYITFPLCHFQFVVSHTENMSL